ncbi:hypothetical protein L7F22_068942 [Adiantum nelumboides]|nr:hypothetical protein [Adiantum nelumboides]
MAFPNFYEKRYESASNFLDDLEMAFLVFGRDEEEVKLRAFPRIVREEAKVWFQGLEPRKKDDWGTLREAFMGKFGGGCSPEESMKLIFLSCGLNGKVNGMICKIITKHVGNKAQKWDLHLDATLWAYRTSFKAYTPFQLVYGQEALLPIEVELSSLRVLQTREGSPKEKLKQRILALEKLKLDREEAILHYISQAEKRRQKFNKKLKTKDIEEKSLVLRYDNKFDHKKNGKFVPYWEGPFKVVKIFDNGSYQLINTTGKPHKTRVNGWRLKLYFSQNFFDNEQWEQEA